MPVYDSFMKYGMITVINYDVIEFWLCGVYKMIG